MPPEQLGDVPARSPRAARPLRLHRRFYGHFGQGCVHTRINFDLDDRRRRRDSTALHRRRGGPRRRATAARSRASTATASRKAELLPKMFGPELVAAFREFKPIWDPDGQMNPGKVVDAVPHRREPAARHRLSTRRRRRRTSSFPTTAAASRRATLRCVGVGECRRTDGGTMCPSYMVTREEKHSTRGRARLLFEMLEGDRVRDGWQSEEVKDALDLCLACKGCKGDCPVHVDMATYKAEFLSHYYEDGIAAAHAYAFGLIHRWARARSDRAGARELRRRRRRGCAAIAKCSPASRRSGRFRASRRGRSRAGSRRPAARPRRRARRCSGPTRSTTTFIPDTAIAAVEVLEDAGFDVIVPARAPCAAAGRSTTTACSTSREQLLRQILDALRDEIDAGIPIVGLEPSCVGRVPRRAAATCCRTIEDAGGWPRRSTLLASSSREHSDRLRAAAARRGRARARPLPSQGACSTSTPTTPSCCERWASTSTCPTRAAAAWPARSASRRDHYDVSMAVGERVLLPAVRDARAATRSSCRRLQLPRADRAGDGPPRAASRRGAARRAGRRGLGSEMLDRGAT